MRTYAQLTQEQRYQIYALKKMGHNQTEIAYVLEVHKSTISRELHRNAGQRGYRPQQAQSLAMERRPKSVPRIPAETWGLVEKLLRQDWSPEQISGRLKKEQGQCISHEWICRYVREDKRSIFQRRSSPAKKKWSFSRAAIKQRPSRSRGRSFIWVRSKIWRTRFCWASRRG